MPDPPSEVGSGSDPSVCNLFRSHGTDYRPDRETEAWAGE